MAITIISPVARGATLTLRWYDAACTCYSPVYPSSIISVLSYDPRISALTHRLRKGWYTVAAPDHKIGQCIQRSALFPGRAGGGTHGSERFAGGAICAKRRGGRFGKGRRNPSPLGDLWAMPPKISKNQLWNRVFSAFFCKLKWFHLQHRQGNFD